MTEDKHLEYSKKIQALRLKFVGQLPQRLAEARLLALSLPPGLVEEGPPLVELHRFFHTIKGTANSFAFEGFATLADTGETILASVLKTPRDWTKEHYDQILNCLEGMNDGLPELRSQLSSIIPLPESGFITEIRQDPENMTARNALVYVCDDDLIQAELMGTQLQYFGYQIRIFSDTDSLQRAVLALKPDGVIMDLMFPQGPFQGAEVLANLRAQGWDFPALFISSRSDFQARIQAIRAGGVGYFTKPVEALDLLDMLDRMTHQTLIVPYKILVIDDDWAVGNFHALILENAGMTVQITQNPETILEVVNSFKPDLVLMDMYMPYCSGREAAALIRQIPEFLSLPIIFLSSETDKQKQFSAMSVGVEGFLTKPIQPDDLVSSVLLSADRMRTLQSLMTRDSLTGLFNHTTTTQILESSLGAARRSGSGLCFAMIDLDHFKAVNDTYGHPMGDQVLLAISRVLRQRLRASDVVGRYGGEEFAIILGNIEPQAARELMDSLRLDFSRIVFPWAGQPFSCTFSCGIADSPNHPSVDALRDAADRALYTAKREGRNRIVFYGEETNHGI